MFGNIFLGRVRGTLEEDLNFQHRFFVQMLLLLHNNVYEMQCLINYYGETDLQRGAHFAKNNILRVVLVEEVENMGCLSSYVQ